MAFHHFYILSTQPYPVCHIQLPALSSDMFIKSVLPILRIVDPESVNPCESMSHRDAVKVLYVTSVTSDPYETA